MSDEVISRSSIGRLLRRYVAVICLTIPAVGFGVGGWFLPTKDKPSEFYLKIICCSLILIAGLYGVGWMIWRMLREPAWVEVGPAGLRWRVGGVDRQAAWTEIAEVYRQELHVLVNNAKPSEWNLQSFVRIVFADRSVPTLEIHVTMTNYDALADAIMLHAYKALAPSKVAEMREAGQVKFGPVVVGKDGLMIQGKMRRWNEINYGVNKGNLVVGPDIPDFKYHDVTEVPLATIPNYLAALQLMENVGKPASTACEFYPKEMRPYMMKRA